MSTSKQIDKICISAICLMLAVTLLFLCGGQLGITAAAQTMKYEKTLFDTDIVHKIDIVMDDWNGFLEGCESEEYSSCTVVIDGKQYKNTAIRAKGNTSLSNVSSMGSQRYSFKLEFDHYEEGRTCDGLDKLCLNNLIQDNTMMKDYLVYQMMADFGVDAPLSSFAYITVNGEDWGLYLAVESVEDSFLTRNYGADVGELYKPDSMSFGGGRGNGKGFDMDAFDLGGSAGGQFRMPGEMGEKTGGFGGMGSDDVKLKYIDDDPDSYPNIFDNAKTEVTAADKRRLLSALKNLSDYTDLENTIDMEEVLRYFVVHNFVCNGDSYTGSMIHNYYLHEKDGKLGMIPWDYNLAFGTFQGGNGSDSVNSSIDSPVSGGNVNDRPMVGWIFSQECYTEQYHQLFNQFMEKWFSNGELTALIASTAEMLRPYVEKDPTRFCTVEEFEAGVTAITQFVSLRGEAVQRQLKGDNTPVDTAGLNLSDMGSMSGGFGGGRNQEFDRADRPFQGEKDSDLTSMPEMPGGSDFPSRMQGNPGNGKPTGNREMPIPPAMSMDEQLSADSDSPWGLIGLSMLTLIAGLMIAAKKKY